MTVNLMTHIAPKWLRDSEHTQCEYTVHVIIHILGEKDLDDVRLHHATQNRTYFKNYELFISEILHLLF